MGMVTSAELIRHFGVWQDRALREPVLITHHGRKHLILVSSEHYDSISSVNIPSRNGYATESNLTADLMNFVAQGFVAFDRDMRIAMINQAACAFYKISRDAIVGHHLGEFIPGIEGSIGYAALLRAIGSGEISRSEIPSFAYENRFLLFETFPWRDGVACIFRDITDDMELRSIHDYNAAIAEAISGHGSIGTAILSGDGSFTQVNETMTNALGFAIGALAGSKIASVLLPEYRRIFIELIESAIINNRRAIIDAELLGHSGIKIPAKIIISPLRYKHIPSVAAIIQF